MSSFRLTTPNKITSKTIGTLYAEMLRPGSARLNLSPVYQRKRCWNKGQNDTLIDSIMCGLVIPLFTFYTMQSATETDAEDYRCGVRFECVDGQNRLCAIASFLSGIPITNDRGVAEYVCWGRKHFSELTEEEQELFTNTDLPLAIVQSPMDMDQRRDMFTRLQAGTRISRPELLRNSTHPVSKFVARTGMRDKFLGAVQGFMNGGTPKGEWLLVIADCVTLYLNRMGGASYEVLNRDSSRLNRVIEGREAGKPGTPYFMEVTTPDDEPLKVLFNDLLTILESVKADKVKYQKFCAVVLFNQLSLRARRFPLSSACISGSRAAMPLRLPTRRRVDAMSTSMRCFRRTSLRSCRRRRRPSPSGSPSRRRSAMLCGPSTLESQRLVYANAARAPSLGLSAGAGSRRTLWLLPMAGRMTSPTSSPPV